MKTPHSISLATVGALFLLLSGYSYRFASPDPFEKALDQAKMEKKRVLLDLYAPWCAPCKKLNEVMTDSKIQNLLKSSFVVLKINADTEYGKQLMKQYSVAGLPALIVIDKDGKKAERILSSGLFNIYQPAGMLQRLSLASKGQSELDYLLQQWNENPEAKNSSKLAYNVGMVHISQRNEQEALKWMRRAVQLDMNNEAGDAANALYALGDDFYNRELKNSVRARQYFQTIQKTYPESITATHAAKSEAKMLWDEGDRAGAKIVLLNLVRQVPQSMAARHRFAEFCLDHNYVIEEAIKIVEEGIQHTSHETQGLWEDLAQLYAKQGNCKKSLSAIQKALQETPDSQYTKDVYKEILECRNG